MDSADLYRQLLGLATPWTVGRVEMDVHGLRVDVHLAHAAAARFACPECGKECSVYDHASPRQWRHLDSCHFHTVLHARAPRVNCPEHGVRVVELPWAEPGGRFTRLFEALAIELWLGHTYGVKSGLWPAGGTPACGAPEVAGRTLTRIARVS